MRIERGDVAAKHHMSGQPAPAVSIAKGYVARADAFCLIQSRSPHPCGGEIRLPRRYKSRYATWWIRQA